MNEIHITSDNPVYGHCKASYARLGPTFMSNPSEGHVALLLRLSKVRPNVSEAAHQRR